MEPRRWMCRVPLILTLLALGLAAGMIAGAAAPAQTNTLVDLLPWSPETMDPHWLYDTGSAQVTTQVYERLVQRKGPSDAEFVPGLSTGWQVSPGADTYTLTIRSGVTFHAGGTLAPHDVAYSFWRGLIQDRTAGPMWMLFQPLFNRVAIEDLPGDDLTKCQAVKDAITYDDDAGTVTFHLAQPQGPFITLMEGPAASILDRESMIANGGWGGECVDWRDYHDPLAADSTLYDRANGTGPSRLESWTGGEVHLLRFDGY